MSRDISKTLSKFLFYTVGVVLFVYAAARSLDFITATLPPSQAWVGFLALFATGAGAVSWLFTYLHFGSGSAQKTIALVMVAVDTVGEGALYSFDTLFRSGESGMIGELTQDDIRLVIIGLSALIFLNLAAIIAFKISDPETSKRMKEESARDALNAEVLRVIEERAPQLAEEIAPRITAEWEADFAKRFANMNALGLGSLPTHPETLAGKNGNGRKYQATEETNPTRLPTSDS